jgi:uncharacterized protein
MRLGSMREPQTILPAFRYHPDPVSTGSVKASRDVCICCGKTRGFIYTASVYGRLKPEGRLCPWCIANGEAALKFNCFFSDEDPLVRAGVPRAAIIEVTRRTPGYNSWQQEVWLACCNDACVFRGDASISQLNALQGDDLSQLQRDWPISPTRWAQFVKQYTPGGGMAVYRFDCLHCGKTKYSLDLS